MATTNKGSFRVVGTNSKGVQTYVYFDRGWKAQAEAENFEKAGWTEVEVEQFDRKEKAYTPYLPAIKQDAPVQKSLDIEARVSIANLIATAKTLYESSKKSSTDEEVMAFAHECIQTLIECGFTASDLETLVGHVTRTEASV